jgi:hypothetical protein
LILHVDASRFLVGSVSLSSKGVGDIVCYEYIGGSVVCSSPFCEYLSISLPGECLTRRADSSAEQ